MLLIKVFLVAFALAGKRGGKGKGGGRDPIPDECKDPTPDYAAFLKTDATATSEGLLNKLETGTMYCTMNSKFAEWPACPVVEEDETVEDFGGLRRNLKKGGNGKKDKVKYNKARFTMASGTSEYVQVELNSDDATTYQCYEGDAMKFTVAGSELDGEDAIVGRRLLKSGKSKVTATLEMKQTGTADGVCGMKHELTCSIRPDALSVDGNGACTAVSVSCKTPKGSDMKVDMTCYENENDVKGWEDADECPSTVVANDP